MFFFLKVKASQKPKVKRIEKKNFTKATIKISISGLLANINFYLKYLIKCLFLIEVEYTSFFFCCAKPLL